MMVQRHLLSALTFVMAVVSIGCGDSDSSSATANPVEAVAEAQSQRIESLESVDLSELSAEDRAIWADLVNDLLSPCGQPISVARCVAENAGCSACVPAARFLARMTSEGFERLEMREHYRVRYAEDATVDLRVDDVHFRGAAMAPVTIVMFGDFECPHCRMAEPMLRRVLEEYDGRVRVVFKNYPLPGHVNSMPAAKAVVAAGNQGKFWEMHDLLFENQTRLERADIDRYAGQVGLDMARFAADMASEETLARVEADRAEGQAAGVDGTPRIFVNNRLYDMGLEFLGAYVGEELER